MFLRRSIIPLLLTLCMPAIAHAQLRVGASVDFNRSSFGGVPPAHAEYAANYGVGVAAIVEYRVHRDVVLSLQPGWIQKGAEIDFNKDEKPDSVQTFVVEQTWMTVPVYFRIDSDDRGFYAGGGFSVDALLTSHLEHAGVKVDNKSFFDDLDAVYQFSVGYMHPTGKHSLFLEARYMQGLVNLNKSSRTTTGDIYVADFKSNGLRLVAGFLF